MRLALMSKPDVIVIGAGMGGLSTAAFLLKRGLKPLVLEHHYQAGGYVSAFKRRGYVFDCAVDAIAGLDPGGLLDGILKGLGVRKEVEALPLVPVRETRFPGLTVSVPPTAGEYEDLLCGLFPAEEDGVRSLLGEAGEILDAVYARLDEATGPFSGNRVSSVLKRNGPRTWKELLDSHLSDDRLKAVLSDRSQYLGLPPSRLSAVQAAVAVFSYFREGASRIRGGSQSLADAMVRGIRRQGGEVRLSCGVGRILVRGGAAAGVVTEAGEEIPARAVVSTADPVQTVGRLLGGEAPERVSREEQRTAVSFFLVYLGVSIRQNTLPPVSSIGVFPVWDVERALDAGDPFGRDAAFGISIPTLLDPDLAPAGRQVVIIHKDVPYDFTADWPGQKEKLAGEMIAKADGVIPGLSQAIDVMEIATPLTLERYTRNLRGSAYGWEQVPRRRPTASPVEGLHFAGHWTSVGGGVLAAAYSGLLAARSVEASLGRLAKRV
ncbi:MAG: NAD(P)/FAD-dependent oxidoreductase [Nitrospirota bacterium]